MSKYSESDLIRLIADLYTLSSSNKSFLEARFIRNDAVLAQYKKLIKKYIIPDKLCDSLQFVNLKGAKKAINDYSKATNDTIGLIDLMVYYVESGTDFLCTFGDANEKYYGSLESFFSNALKLMKTLEHKDILRFEKRLRIVVKKSENMGWGYYDAISDMLDTAYLKS